MKFSYLDIGNSGELFGVYNEQTADVPHCYPISQEEFKVGLCDPRNDSHCKESHSEKIIAVEQSGKVAGFAHVAIVRIEFSDRKRIGGMIHFFTYKAGQRSVGQALLEECENYLHGLGTDQIWACQNGCNYRFHHLEFGNISDHWGHIFALFHMNGYKINEGEIFMSEPNYSVTEPILPDSKVEIAVRQQPSHGILPGMLIQIFCDGEEIGICRSTSAGDCVQATEAQDCFFIHWLGVERKEQGNGWGRYLLQKTRWEMRKIGYRNAVISTDILNHRALLFYTNYGYRVSDTVYGFVKN